MLDLARLHCHACLISHSLSSKCCCTYLCRFNC